MSVSKHFTQNPENVKRVLEAYLSDDRPTLEETAKRVSTTFHNVHFVVRNHLSEEKAKAEKALRYSRSKMGAANPMKGKTGKQHPNWKGECGDGYGYLTCLVDGKRVFVHRVVFAEMMGISIEKLPPALAVHHINGDRKDNRPDNLALTTKAGHQHIHTREKPERLSKSPLWEQWVSGPLK